ncbi:putative intracellular protein transporter [Phaeomoniella chlamydospora]|uniref:Putative intracellular protein transporter n=1 Tax=Phaeomoniella chlamydospora TaxID=158046 RepID=A0A0G2ENE6_PHACM|nr:putative intracellular protein transporter [Phaeomoniella chlamydospora]
MPPPLRRPGGHTRSASLQVMPRSETVGHDNTRNGLAIRNSRPSRHPSLNHLDNARSNLQVPPKPTHRSSALRTPSISPTASEGGRRIPSPRTPDFKFPAASPSSDKSSPGASDPKWPSVPEGQDAANHAKAAPMHGSSLTASVAATRILSGASIDGSVRSSGEFYSMSNQSTDTLASEQPRRPMFSAHNRVHSTLGPIVRTRKPEKLLMGYAQINASFAVDGSLVDQSPFDEVKRKGFMGGQGGGGVVGVEKRKSTGGFLSGFNLGSISESLGGLLNPQDMSSSKEMKGVVSSRSVPLLSTPQSLLFVDMELKPGEQRSFSYSFRIPKGLPATHKGKAIKVSYCLVVGTQFASNANSPQKVRSVTVPLRVFSAVNSDGEVLGHDLMYPYVILKDTAITSSLDRPTLETQPLAALPQISFTSDFSAYAQTLIDKQFRRQSSAATLDEAAMFAGRGPSSNSDSPKELIRLAILRSNQAADSERSPNRFEISRNGRYVGVVVLNRPSHRIGETVVASVDFASAQLPTLSLRCMLETVEKVEPSLALRSVASINRATKKVHASQAENTLYAKRAIFSPSIPVSATPSLYTTGISLHWQLRFEFATIKSTPGTSDSGTSMSSSSLDLLEDIGSDERGVSQVAIETIRSDSFEVVIPLTVYGDIIKETEVDEVIGLPI